MFFSLGGLQCLLLDPGATTLNPTMKRSYFCLGKISSSTDVAESALLVEKVRGVAVAGVAVAIQGLKLRLLAA